MASKARSSFLGNLRNRGRWHFLRALRHVPTFRRRKKFAAGIVKVDRLGDLVLATSAIRLLTEHYGPKNCLLVISPFAREIAGREFPDTPQIVVPPFVAKKTRKIFPVWWRQRSGLRACIFDQVVSLRHFPSIYRDALLSWLPSRTVHGLSGDPFAEFIGGKFPFKQTFAYPQSADASLSFDLEGYRLILESVLQRKITPDEVKPRLRSLAPTIGDNLLVAPFASERVKDYPAASLIEALRLFTNQSTLPIDVIVAPDQAARLPDFEQQARTANVSLRSARVCPNLDDYFKTLASAKAILTMDSASSHLAGAIDKPVVTLLGGGHGRMFGPWWHSPNRQIWLRHDIACQNCNWACSQPENYCLSRIAPTEVAAALHRVLATRPATPPSRSP